MIMTMTMMIMIMLRKIIMINNYVQHNDDNDNDEEDDNDYDDEHDDDDDNKEDDDNDDKLTVCIDLFDHLPGLLQGRVTAERLLGLHQFRHGDPAIVIAIHGVEGSTYFLLRQKRKIEHKISMKLSSIIFI